MSSFFILPVSRLHLEIKTLLLQCGGGSCLKGLNRSREVCMKYHHPWEFRVDTGAVRELWKKKICFLWIWSKMAPCFWSEWTLIRLQLLLFTFQRPAAMKRVRTRRKGELGVLQMETVHLSWVIYFWASVCRRCSESADWRIHTAASFRTVSAVTCGNLRGWMRGAARSGAEYLQAAANPACGGAFGNVFSIRSSNC